GATAKDNRLYVNAVLWIAKTGAPWRDLPERFGNWNSVFQRFSRWCKNGVFQSIMEKLQDPDLGVLLLDSTIIRVHQHAAGAEGSCAEAYEEVLPVVHRRLSREPETTVMVMALDEGPEQEEELGHKEVAA